MNLKKTVKNIKAGKNTGKEKGASMIILALIILIFTSITIIGVTKLVISEKLRTASTSVSTKAYQKADEAAECALWARKRAIQACSEVDLSTDQPMFAEDIFKTHCSNYYDPDDPVNYEFTIELYKTLNETEGELTKNCASPYDASYVLTKGRQTTKDTPEESEFSGPLTKIRAIGATVKTFESDIFEPYVCCNKIAEYGQVRDPATALGCEQSDNELSDDLGPDNDRGWLNYWEFKCGTTCSDPCAYYDTTIDDGATNLYSDPAQFEGAHWCWTEYLDNELVEKGTMCWCLNEHREDEDRVKYWQHPDVININDSGEAFCDPCNRIYDPDGTFNNNSCGSGSLVGSLNGGLYTGQVCLTAPTSADMTDIWGQGGIPPEGSRGVLYLDNPWACNCSAFRSMGENEEWCAAQGY